VAVLFISVVASHLIWLRFVVPIFCGDASRDRSLLLFLREVRLAIALNPHATEGAGQPSAPNFFIVS